MVWSPLSAGCLECGPADFGSPSGVVRRIAGSEVVDLPDRADHFECVLLDVGPEGAVGDIDVMVRAGVDCGGQLGGGADERLDCARAGRFGDGDVDDHRAALVAESLVLVEAPGRAGGWLA